MLFTHRGVSGPAILQVSSYWRPGSVVKVDLLPKLDLRAALAEARSTRPRAMLRSTLGQWLPRGLVKALEGQEVQVVPTAQLSDHGIEQVAAALHGFSWQPAGTAGWATAEVTVGGVDTRAISSKTMEAREVPGLYFVGEVLDVTGWLGGYNLQWAWSSGWCCGRSA
jgi:hypothetical protein